MTVLATKIGLIAGGGAAAIGSTSVAIAPIVAAGAALVPVATILPIVDQELKKMRQEEEEATTSG